jgi:hypothetical protein
MNALHVLLLCVAVAAAEEAISMEKQDEIEFLSPGEVLDLR